MVSSTQLFKTPARHAFSVVVFFTFLFILFFSPVLFSGHLLAPGSGGFGDAVVYHLAYFRSPTVLWDELLANGFPMMADPQVMAWYPPARLLSFIPGGWNAFIVSAYVMASSFTYGFVHSSTRSRFSGAVAGITYGMCGFMVAHMGHTAMIHSAVWLPLIVWSIQMLRKEFNRWWLLVGCLAVSCCIFAGHLQIVAYSLVVSAAYALVVGLRQRDGRLQFFILMGLMFVIGIGLAAVQILPAQQLAQFSLRSGFTFQDFASYSLPLSHLALLIFPAALGGLPHYGAAPYFGEWNLIEMTGYAGVIPVVLALVAVSRLRREALVVFWAAVALFGILLALGDRTPLAIVIYQLPILSQFRAPARHLIEVTFALSVLAGWGTQAVVSKLHSRRAVVLAIALTGLAMLVAAIVLNSNSIRQMAASRGLATYSAMPWSNAAVAAPIAIFLVGIALILFWQREPGSFIRRALVLAVLIIDLGSFGWFFNWRFASPPRAVLNEPASAVKVRELLNSTGQRMLSVRGTTGATDELIPNLSRLWQVPNATGYGPLLPSRLLYFLSILPDGSIAPTWRDAEDQSLNLSSVRYVLTPKHGTVRDARGNLWPEENMDIWLGSGCDHGPRESVLFDLPSPAAATEVGIVSRLACSVGRKDNEEVAQILLTDVDGNVQKQSLLAGRDSSEWSYDCPSIKPRVEHNRAEIFSDYPARMYDDPCLGHLYVSKIKLRSDKQITRVELRPMGAGAIVIEKLVLIDSQRNAFEPLHATLSMGDRWKFVADVGSARLFENTTALPRAWLVSETAQLSPEETLRAIKTSQLPDGSKFDPTKTALVENSPTSHPASAGATARVLRVSGTTMEVETSSTTPAFLVTSDNYYPGWEATVDGKNVELFRANYVLRGVEVPSGTHRVIFEFAPTRFYYGLIVSVLSVLVLVGLVISGHKFKPLNTRKTSA